MGRIGGKFLNKNARFFRGNEWFFGRINTENILSRQGAKLRWKKIELEKLKINLGECS